MAYEIDTEKYEIIVASNVTYDGLGIELWDKEKKRLLIEIFRSDAKKRIEFFAWDVELSLELVEMVIKQFDARVGREFQE